MLYNGVTWLEMVEKIVEEVEEMVEEVEEMVEAMRRWCRQDDGSQAGIHPATVCLSVSGNVFCRHSLNGVRSD